MLLKTGKEEVRQRKNRSYPWDSLSEVGSFFIWSDKNDALSIRSNAKNKGIRVSVTTQEDKTLFVQRIG